MVSVHKSIAAPISVYVIIIIFSPLLLSLLIATLPLIRRPLCINFDTRTIEYVNYLFTVISV